MIPFFEVGVVYAVVVSLYTLYPLVGYVVNGLGYTFFNDQRLFQTQPAPQEIGTVGWYHVVHLLSFVTVYLLVRGRLPREQARPPRPDGTTWLFVIALYLAISGFLLVLNLSFDLSASTYSETYLVSRRLPLFLAQLFNHLDGARFTCLLAILVMLFGNYHKYRWLILGVLALTALTTFQRLGSRTELMLSLLSAALLYHFWVRPIPFRVIALAGLAGLSMFVLLGLLRGGQSLGGLGLAFNPFAHASEFESVFANAYDLSRLKAMGAVGDLPPTFYLTDLAALVPQQLVPFTKISPSVWYVNTFYPEYAATGGGFAFGTISESVLGAGWVDLAARGGALGLILAGLQRYMATHRPTFWSFVFQVWVTVLVYQSFRNTTFSLLVLFFYRFLPVVVGARLLSAFLKGSVRRLPRSIPEHA